MAGMDILAVVTHEATTLDPSDNFVNTFAISSTSPAPGATALNSMCDLLHSFYNTLSGTTTLSIDNYLSEYIRRTAGGRKVQLYDITGKLANVAYTKPNGEPGVKPPPHGSPILTRSYTVGISAPGQISLPEEVALVMTTRALGWSEQVIERADAGDIGSAVDRPRQRYTGRNYIGPFNSKALANSTTQSRPVQDLITTILDGAARLQTGLATADASFWSVWSRSDGDLRSIDAVQVDNAWDTQRRRGTASSARTTRDV